MRKYLLLILLIADTLCFGSGRLEVESVETLDGTNLQISKYDADGKYAPLLFVKTELKPLQFQNVGRGNRNEPEWDAMNHRWKCYLNVGQNRIKIGSTGYDPIHINLRDYGVTSEEKRCYVLILINHPEHETIPFSIISDPADAEKWIDGENFGTDQGFQLEIGSHELELRKSGYVTKKLTIDVNRSTPFVNGGTLSAQNPVTVTIQSSPDKARIYIDGADKDETLRSLFLYPGIYQLKLVKSSYVDIEEEIEVIDGANNEFSYTLSEVTGDLQFSVIPDNARITLTRDGNEVETWIGSKTLKGLRIGEYQLVGEVKGYKTKTTTLKIKSSNVTNTSLSLEKGSDFEMVYVEGGTFRMGSNEKETNNVPVRKVTVSSFYIGTYEVTQEQWQNFMEDNPSNNWGDDLPVEQVTWRDCIDFCNKLSKKDGLTPVYSVYGSDVYMDIEASGYRLPTEAEWEYAARGGNRSKGYKYCGSDNVDAVAWYEQNSGDKRLHGTLTYQDCKSNNCKTHPVGKKQSNELGIYDMSGNVSEWCWDWHDPDYGHKSPAKNPVGPPDGTRHSVRGGDWYHGRDVCRVDYRMIPSPYGSDFGVGFRLCRSKRNVKHAKKNSEPSQIYTSKSGIETILVEGGKFQMGSDYGENNRKPMHDVTLSSFYIGKFEITQEQWEEVMKQNPSKFIGKNHPVEKISWYDAIEFCNKLSKKEGLKPCYKINKSKKDPNNKSKRDDLKWIVTCDFNASGYRLPTEAEWEYAARGGKQSKGYKYSGSRDPEAVSWFWGNSNDKHHSVGGKQPNELGIHDMSGNVYEMCWDWYDSGYYSRCPARNPKGPSSGSCRAERGGFWDTQEGYLEVLKRGNCDQARRNYRVGIRICRSAI